MDDERLDMERAFGVASTDREPCCVAENTHLGPGHVVFHVPTILRWAMEESLAEHFPIATTVEGRIQVS